ncbi:lipopolysaccharide 3-alpha-galactosyltransferase [Providencia stuartii]|uniref:lipopolysaccharide 3-alpha-galactosyltransferase n=1 Tax=Providencia stuartii TaxID=588 RepID=UPI0028C32C89|nr:lipopolysaccharide 3-alpha-galactosyltransferase [Providencia stuartii]MDT7052145.1 lipopolysaccharide 3-alpha-galactosyltransferase [Providencia stuartii]
MVVEFDKMIQQVIPLGVSDLDISSYFHVAYGIDHNFLYGCGVSIASLLMHNERTNFSFHVFIDDSISDTDLARFRELSDDYNVQITLYIINSSSIKTLPTTKNWTHAIYFRFIVAEYFINKIDYLLYLDADVVCNNSIEGLTQLDLQNKVAAVVTERDENWWKKRAQTLGFPEVSAGYFNSGVVYVNLAVWEENQVTKKSMSLLMDTNINHKISYPDQDVLNILLADKVVYLDVVYNTQFSLNYELKDQFHYPVNQNTIFIHYVGPTKPWHEWATYETAKPFSDARSVSPWNNVPLLKAKNSNHLRYCAKHMFNQGKLFSGIKNSIQYFWAKLSN